MEFDAEYEVPTLNRKFAYTEILWEINKYLSAVCTNNWVIDSPEFSVRGSQVTKWKLTLRQTYIRKRYAVLAFVERVESDNYPKPVRMRWKLRYSVGDIERTVSETSKIFIQKSSFGVEIKNMEEVEEKMRKTAHDRLWIRCIMIVYDMDGSRFGPSTDLGLRSLSQDMTVLYRLNKHSDITLQIGQIGPHIQAHKGILSARNEVLKTEIDNDTSEIEFNYDWVEKDAAKNIVAFLYTGNLKYVFRMPSFSMHVLIDYLRIKELKKYFAKDELSIRTSYDVQDILANWIIPKNSLTVDELVSDSWRLGFVDACFRFRLVFKGVNNNEEQQQNEDGAEKPENAVSGSGSNVNRTTKNPSAEERQRKRDENENNKETVQKHQDQQSQQENNNKRMEPNNDASQENSENENDPEAEETNEEEEEYVSIYVEFINGEPPREVYLSCAIYDVNDKLEIMNGVIWNSAGGKKLGIEKFFTKKMLNHPSFLNKDRLSISVKLRMPSGVKRHSVISSKTCYMDFPDVDHHYGKLSQHLGILFQNGDYSDFTVATGNVVSFRVHKGILSTRSHVFWEMIKEHRGEDSITINDIDARTLHIVLRYIYTGTLQNYESEDITKIYNAAVEYGVLSLRNTCTQILRDNVNLQNALEILVLAHEKKEYKLKDFVLKFICRHLDDVQSQENFDSFLDGHPEVSSELVEFCRYYIEILKAKTK